MAAGGEPPGHHYLAMASSNPCSSSSPSPVVKKSRVQVYDLSWAAMIFRRAYKSHARAWDIILEVLHLRERHIAGLIACADPDWPRLRDLSHWVERHLEKVERWVTQKTAPYVYGDICKAVLHRISCMNVSDRLKFYLTKRDFQAIMKEQGFEGEVDAQAETSPRLFRPEEVAPIGRDLTPSFRIPEKPSIIGQKPPISQPVDR